MKKLMFAAAAIAAGVAMADVTSANIVGYMNQALPVDGLAVGPAFINVSGETIDLMDISVTGYPDFDYEKDEGGARGDVQVSTLNGGGDSDKNYKWYDYTIKGESPDEDKVLKGWYRISGRNRYELVRGEVVLQPGEGLWSVTSAENQKFVAAGQVVTEADQPTELPVDGLMVANPTPVAVDLINVYVRGYPPFDYEKDEGGARGDVQVSTLNGGGDSDKNYKWYDYTIKGETPADDKVLFGWYRISGRNRYELEKNEVVLQPGEGLWSVTSAEDQKLYWPKVEVAK